MDLLYQTHSPYARKVLVAAHEMGLQHELSVIHQETSPTRPPREAPALGLTMGLLRKWAALDCR
jgi:hypothetical protein